MTHLGALTCRYDRRGNLIAKETPLGTYRYTYDALNRLISVDTPSGRHHYSYDPLGRRLTKNKERYLWDDKIEIGSFISKDKPVNLRILGPSYIRPAFIEIAQETYTPITDSLGNLRCLIDSSQNREEFDYTAFGTPLTQNACPWTFASTRFDPETGLYCYLRRYYDPALKRWLTQDPSGFLDSTNLYQYVLNNPLRFTDPKGEFIIAIPILLFGAQLTFEVICAAAIE